MGKFFGTDGIRGVANKELTCALALKVGMAVAYTLGKGSKILVGKDPRISSNMLEAALLAGISSMGANAVSLGVVPTPAVAYLTLEEKADAGIMISASHNSFEFNGIKIFGNKGYKLPDEMEEKIEDLISRNIDDLLPEAEAIGKIEKCADAIEKYAKYIKNAVKLPEKKEIKMLVDCSNGSSSFTAERIFGELGIKADFIFHSPDGININENCGSTHIENLAEKVKEKSYDIAFAFDGDADRCLAVDELGNVIDGDFILGICADHMKKNGTLKGNALVGTIMSNMGLKKFCSENEISFEETNVGDRCVLERMTQKGYSLGGEQSGHIIFLENSTTGDGQLTALKLIEILLSSGKKASELRKIVKKYPQKSSAVKINFSQKGMFAKNEEIKAYLEEVKKEIGNKGRIVVRESGTEPKIRVMTEHESEEAAEEITKKLAETISKMMEK